MWQKEKLLVTSNFCFSHSVSKRLVLQTRKNQGLFGKGLMSGWEDQINKYLEEQGVTPVTILYENKIYPKTYLDDPSNASVIKIKGVRINDENKPFLQLLLE